MNSLTDLREVVDVVIGVDTHVHTHSAAVVDTATGGVLDEITVEATAEGYAELVEFANNYATLRAWAIEGTGGHGAGLSRHLLESSEIVIELDRPKRAARRHGAKSDPLDAIRAAREAMARPRLGTPRTGGERQALSVLLAARRSAITASTEAQQQVFSLGIAAPEPIRGRFRGQTRSTASTRGRPADIVLVEGGEVVERGLGVGDGIADQDSQGSSWRRRQSDRAHPAGHPGAGQAPSRPNRVGRGDRAAGGPRRRAGRSGSSGSVPVLLVRGQLPLHEGRFPE
jgi:transposase